MKLILCVLISLLGLSDAQFPVTLPKCSFFDAKCQINFFLGIRTEFASKGVPALGVPSIDPMKLAPVNLDIFGLWNLKFYDAQVTGIGKCTVPGLNTDLKTRTKTIQLSCDSLVVTGLYELQPSSVVQDSYYNFNGNGQLNMTFDNWYFKFTYPFNIRKHADNKIYVEGDFAKAKNESSVDLVTTELNGMNLGGINIDYLANCWVNDNWQLLMGSNIGKLINANAYKYYCGIYNKFFNTVAAEYYIKEDLTPYIINN